jgi:molybdate transport system ATP-binding protein
MLSVEIKTVFKNSKVAGEDRNRDFSLEINFIAEPGITILFGPSGSGKSTTLAIIAGIVIPDYGRIKIEDHTLFDSSQNINLPIQKRNIGIVFQNLALFDHLTVLQNVIYGLADRPKKERFDRAIDMLSRFGIEDLKDRKTSQISGGERQRVALARSLVTNPKTLLLDEPFSALDSINKRTIMRDLQRISLNSSIPILLVTHDRSEAIALGHKMLVYESGKIIAQGAPLAVLGAPRTSSVASLAGVENILVGRVELLHQERGTMSLRCDPITIEIPLGEQKVGDLVHIAISARDILVSTEEPRSTSARNIFKGAIKEIEEKEINLYVMVECGIPIIALITKHAAQELGLRLGLTIWLAFKAHSCYLLDQNIDQK